MMYNKDVYLIYYIQLEYLSTKFKCFILLIKYVFQ